MHSMHSMRAQVPGHNISALRLFGNSSSPAFQVSCHSTTSTMGLGADGKKSHDDELGLMFWINWWWGNDAKGTLVTRGDFILELYRQFIELDFKAGVRITCTHHDRHFCVHSTGRRVCS